MTQKNFLSGLSLSSFLFAAPLAAGERDLLKIADLETDFGMYFPNLAETRKNWEGSPFRKLYQSEPIQDWVKERSEEVSNDLTKALGGKKSMDELSEGLLALAGELQEEVFLSLEIPEVDLALIEKFQQVVEEGTDEERADLLLGTVGAQVLAEVEDAEAFQEEADQLFALVGKQLKEQEASLRIEAREVESVKVTELIAKQGDLERIVGTFGIVGNTAFLTLAKTDTESLIERIRKGAEEELAGADYLDQERSDLQLMGDLGDFWKGLETGLQFGLQEAGLLDQVQINVEAGWKELGFSEFDQMSLAFDLSGQHPEIRFAHTLPQEGLFKALMPVSQVQELSPLAHDRVLEVSQTSIDLEGLYDHLLKTVGAISPMGPMVLNMQLAKLEKLMGVKLKEDLLSHLGDRVETLRFEMDQESDNPLAGQAVLIELTDEEALTGTLKTMMGALQVETKEEEFLGQKLTVLPALGGNDFVYTILEGKLLFSAAEGGAVKEVIKQRENPRKLVWEREFLQAERDFLDGEILGVGVAGIDHQLKEMEGILKDLADEEDSAGKDLFPDLDQLENPFSYMAFVNWEEDHFFKARWIFFTK